MVLTTLKKPEHNGMSIRIPLTTLTPLYTGGIGQYGEQVHPSGLLGSIRYFSCLVAAAVGDREFINQVWGSTGDQHAHAKQVAFRWEVEGLQKVNLPSSITLKRDDGKNSKWFFTCAQQGNLVLVLTERGISDAHWNLLLIALRIQIRWASFGAKDQFGLGVLACESLPEVKALSITVTRPVDTNNFWYMAFFKVTLVKKPGKTEDQLQNISSRLSMGLNCRSLLRNALREESDSINMKNLRHCMMGSLNECGSCVDVSAAYFNKSSGFYEQRLTVLLKPKESNKRQLVMKRFMSVLNNMDHELWRCGEVSYEWGGSVGQSKTISEWLNHLAGVQ